MSFLEAGTNTLVGLGVGFVANYTLLPLWGLRPRLSDSFQIAVVYMLIAWGRNYVMRRIFEGWR